MSQPKSALVLVMSDITRDPRVRRQIDWLVDAGWTVDTIGHGARVPRVRDHFVLADEKAWTKRTYGTALIYGLLPHRRKFKILTQNRIAQEAQRRVRDGEYALVVFNDRHFVPLIADTKVFTTKARQAHIHLDLHEYFVRTYKRNNLWRIATTGHYEWSRNLFASPVFTTRSTVNSGIAQLYEDELGVAPLAVIRNSPPFVQQSAGPVDPQQIKLLHHGIANWDRGLREIVDAMRLLDERFTMTFMLLGSDEIISELKEYSADLGDRVRIVPPAPMQTLSRVVNEFDLEIMFYKPKSRNLELALPNKLFEAVQGRLGLIVGESPMMVDIVNKYANGAVVRGWSAEDLASTLESLTHTDVARLKEASDKAAADLSAEAERDQFLRIISAVPPRTVSIAQ